MIEDKLSTDQRIRLEALAQANNSLAGTLSRSPTLVVERAKAFENYIRHGEGTNAD